MSLPIRWWLETLPSPCGRPRIEMAIQFVDLKRQYLTIKEEVGKAMQDVMDNTSFVLGKPVETFEKNFAKYCGTKHAIGVASGTDALFLALKAAGIKEGDEVI